MPNRGERELSFPHWIHLHMLKCVVQDLMYEIFLLNYTWLSLSQLTEFSSLLLFGRFKKYIYFFSEFFLVFLNNANHISKTKKNCNLQ